MLRQKPTQFYRKSYCKKQPFIFQYVFNTLILKQIFWKTKNFFEKLEYHFLVKTTKIESTSFPFKTALPEANVKTNRMVTTKWTYPKSEVLPVTTLFSLENLFQF